MTRLTEYKFEHIVPIYHDKIKTGSIGWLDNNLGPGTWCVVAGGEWWDFQFENSQDAMMFKLLWGG